MSAVLLHFSMTTIFLISSLSISTYTSTCFPPVSKSILEMIAFLDVSSFSSCSNAPCTPLSPPSYGFKEHHPLSSLLYTHLHLSLFEPLSRTTFTDLLTQLSTKIFIHSNFFPPQFLQFPYPRPVLIPPPPSDLPIHIFVRSRDMHFLPFYSLLYLTYPLCISIFTAFILCIQPLLLPLESLHF